MTFPKCVTFFDILTTKYDRERTQFPTKEDWISPRGASPRLKTTISDQLRAMLVNERKVRSYVYAFDTPPEPCRVSMGIMQVVIYWLQSIHLYVGFVLIVWCNLLPCRICSIWDWYAVTVWIVGVFALWWLGHTSMNVVSKLDCTKWVYLAFIYNLFQFWINRSKLFNKIITF